MNIRPSRSIDLYQIKKDEKLFEEGLWSTDLLAQELKFRSERKM